jgi:hypothetical protein
VGQITPEGGNVGSNITLMIVLALLAIGAVVFAILGGIGIIPERKSNSIMAGAIGAGAVCAILLSYPLAIWESLVFLLSMITGGFIGYKAK